jgi:hypothetical protein
MWVVAVVLCAGCWTAEPGSSGTVTVKTAESCSGEQWAIGELAALKANVKRDPATALNRLGVGVDEFEPIAKALYYKWLEKHPEARPKPAAPAAPVSAPEITTRPSVAFEEGVPVFLVNHWYFCFASTAGPDLCAATSELCESWMASLGTRTGCVVARQGVCFHTSKKLGGKADFALCFRTTSECKEMTETWVANKSNDPIVSGCTIFRSNKSP